jgi:hypothetical protein
MKDLTELINERRQKNWGITTLFFNSFGAYSLFQNEISGQISDGIWENASPSDHWMWVVSKNREIKVMNVGKPHYENNYGIKHRRYKESDYTELFETSNTKFIWRGYNYAKFGKVIANINLIEEEAVPRTILDCLPGLDEQDKTWEQFLENVNKTVYTQQQFKKCEDIVDKKFFEKWQSFKYSERDFFGDVTSLFKTINTFVE